ncbi:PQQ-dependent sugar dehydrogenase [Nocardioides aurantiacus]|uniref:Glucose/arabinose dehydrogenase n=1 Tax=Nocardioides aurantiacus TaxID=86796 RepID=A0A3N2CQZ6_9ACTN|nr:PQQ-dependent sugar dehydrogenase [Nocardioides aurantiacus]ROR89950.1 glucose/arabinose dehydrogenase [Nocardioides aurantiacus]
MKRLVALLVAPVVVLAGCGGGGEATEPEVSETPSPGTADTGSAAASPSPSETVEAASARPKVVGTVASGLQAPWGIDFLPDGSALVTERDTERVFQVGDGEVTRVGQLDQTEPDGEGGLLGVAVSPSYAEDATVFFYLTTGDDNRVVRATFRNGRLGDATPVLTDIPRNDYHDGGRLLFGPDDMLYVSTGDAGDTENAQDLESLGGKILRITPEGEPAPGNPDPDSPVWSYGHRNVQGLAFDDQDRLWASEFGDQTWDELNRIEKGGNYGWPEVEGRDGELAGAIEPQVQWATDDSSPSGLAFVDGRLWLGALQGQRLWRVDVDGSRARDQKGFFVGDYGRIRTVVTAPDGRLWVTTSNRDGRGEPSREDDRILLVEP